MNENTRSIKTNILTIIISVALALFLTVMELAAKKNGMELRTFTQVIKGSYLWLVMPCIILFSGNSLISALQEKDFHEEAEVKLSRVLNRLRSVVVVLFLLGIVFVSLIRGFFYVFTDELITEEMTPDGYIRGTVSDFFSETRHCYYVPTAVFFRKPFPGWQPEELTAKVKEECSPDAELVEKQDGGWYVFRIPNMFFSDEYMLPSDEYIYFHVSDSYTITNNYPLQLFLNEASYFWNVRGRRVTFADENTFIEDAIDRGTDLEEPLSTYGTLYITCYDSQEDISRCAADITDWLQFVKTAGQFPYDSYHYAAYMLTNMQIGNDGSYTSVNLYPLSDYMDDGSWETRFRRMETILTEAFEKHRVPQKQYGQNVPDDDESASDDTADADALFMESYDMNYYEKECLIGDGTVRYRMVVRDAALGSRLYSLLKSTDSGKTWQMSSSLPFGYELGMGIDFTFLDENFGFATLMHNGGDEADLYITQNGGGSYQPVVMEPYFVTLDDGYTYTPYDYPQMPYEEDGILYVLCGQGADGDYDGGDSAGLALYQSTDGGKTFLFVEIQPPAENN
ncbi:MAG: hypothetical protein NC231_14025 [Bacillus sp. (in: Bacteria)]|nr:hypothetical protein [Bacillus sp. (in: firmicutes)]MCM1426641.1 hypothetical protein [Eubacterium sp.]